MIKISTLFCPLLSNFAFHQANSMAAAAMAVETKDWNKLVDIVLRGEAELLVDRISDDTEVQEFLNNAAVFKNKIINIHEGTSDHPASMTLN